MCTVIHLRLHEKIDIKLKKSQILITNLLLFGGYVKNVARKWGLIIGNFIFPESQWLRGLRRGSGAARLLGMRVRILPGAWMSLVSVVC